MKKRFSNIMLDQFLGNTHADLRLEQATVPEWGRHVFTRIESGQFSLADAHQEIDQLVRQRIAAK